MGLRPGGTGLNKPSALSAAQLGVSIAELRPLLEGRRLEDIQALPPADLLLVFAADGEGVLRVRLSAAGDGPRLHLQHGRVERHQGPLGPFFRALGEALPGAALARLEQPRGDRLARLVFDSAARPPRASLVAELTGRHANLVLLDGSERVLELLHAPPARAGARPRLKRGEPWQPPPGSPPADPGPPLAEALPDPGPAPRARAQAPLSWRVEAALGGGAERADRERARRDLAKRLERRLGRARGLVSGLEQRRAAASEVDQVRRTGELLKGNLDRLRRGMESVEVVDWFDPAQPTVRIELDPKRGPRENLERLFERARKLERSAKALEREADLAARRVAALEDLLARLAHEDADPAALETEAVAAKLVDALDTERGKRVQRAAPRLPYKRFQSTSGADLLVGRTARDNDVLTFRVARGNDLWLHTADSPGSHVILRLERGAEPHPEDLLDGAHLAVYFSPLRGATRASIHMAPRKLVHKPRGAPAGLVTLSGGRTREVRLEPDRLARLLAGERAAPGEDGESPGNREAPPG